MNRGMLVLVLLALCRAGVRGASDGGGDRIDLATALRLAGGRPLAVEAARERVREARARLDQDRMAAWPWLAPGVAYRRHDGRIQDIVGDVFDASKQQGSAVVALQAQIEPGEALYRILAARQVVRASEADAEARLRQALLDAAVGYVELARAAAGFASAEETLRLASETVRRVEDAVAAGRASATDAQRVRLQQGRGESARLQAALAMRVASARLAELLRLRPGAPLVPDLGEFVPTVWVAPGMTTDAMVASALAHRPELRRARALIDGASTRRDAAVKAPWIPSLGATVAGGGMAGGRHDGFAGGGWFGDYGLGVAWRVGPGGLGDRARLRSADAAVRLVQIERDQLGDRIAREVVEGRSRADAMAQALGPAATNVATAGRLLALARGRQDFGFGAVFDVIDAERELARAQSENIEAIASHNRSQWELWHALGTSLPVSKPEDPAPHR